MIQFARAAKDEPEAESRQSASQEETTSMGTNRLDLARLESMDPSTWPEGSGAFLLETLRDPQARPADRRTAAQLAGEIVVIDDDLCSALLELLASEKEDEALRSKAAISLGPALEMADEDGFDEWEDVPISEDMFHRIQETLKRLFHQASVPAEIRRSILEASVRAPQDWNEKAIRTAFADADPLWKRTGVFCMEYVDGFEPEILRALESPDPDIHRLAVRAAGAWELAQAWNHVSGLLRPGKVDKPLLLEAMEAAACIRPEDAAPYLTDLMDSPDKEIAEAAEEALAMAEEISEFDVTGEDDEWMDDDWDEESGEEEDEDEDEEKEEDDDEADEEWEDAEIEDEGKSDERPGRGSKGQKPSGPKGRRDRPPK